MDEPAEHVDPFDAADAPDAGECRFRGWDGHVEVDAAVRPGGVVVSDVAGQDVFEVAAVPHQDPVEAFGAHGADPALGVGVGLRCQLRPVWTVDADGCG
jgi:hypothetical protein